MGRRDKNGPNKHHRQDRGGDNKAIVRALREAVKTGESFLSTGASDRDKGSFTDAAKALVAVKAIGEKGLIKFKIPSTALTKLGAGTKIEGITPNKKRGLVQEGVNVATGTLFKDFGVRLG